MSCRYAGMYGAKLMRNFRAFDTVQVYDAAEVKKYDLPPAGATVRVSMRMISYTTTVIPSFRNDTVSNKTGVGGCGTCVRREWRRCRSVSPIVLSKTHCNNVRPFFVYCL